MDLSSYIQDMLNKGYPIQSIKNALLRYGYPEQVIDQTIYNLNQKHGFHLTKTSIIAIIVVMIALAGVSILFLPKSGKVPDQLLDVSIGNIDSEVSPGDFLSASFSLENMGSDKRYDIYLKYEVFDEDSSKRLTWKSETVALETTKTHDISINIPDDADTGNYILQIRARYKTDSAQSTHPFKIKKEKADTASCSDGIKNQDEEDIDCGGVCQPCKKCPDSCDDNDYLSIDYCDASTNFECKHEKPAQCGDNVCSDTESINTCPDDCMQKTKPVVNIWDELDRIKEIAQTDPDKAKQECENIGDDYIDLCLENVGKISADAGTCDKISNDYHRDKCFIDVAKSLKRSVICENVRASKRDTCYSNFIIFGDYTVCDKIQNQYLKKNCNTLKQTAQ